jgi:hypothetical protein
MVAGVLSTACGDLALEGTGDTDGAAIFFRVEPPRADRAPSDRADLLRVIAAFERARSWLVESDGSITLRPVNLEEPPILVLIRR